MEITKKALISEMTKSLIVGYFLDKKIAPVREKMYAASSEDEADSLLEKLRSLSAELDGMWAASDNLFTFLRGISDSKAEDEFLEALQATRYEIDGLGEEFEKLVHGARFDHMIGGGIKGVYVSKVFDYYYGNRKQNTIYEAEVPHEAYDYVVKTITDYLTEVEVEWED